MYNAFYNMLPLTAYKLSWVPVAVIFMLIGYFTYKAKGENDDDTMQYESILPEESIAVLSMGLPEPE